MNIFKIFKNRNNALKISVLGAGSWGTTIGKILSENTYNNYLFENNVLIWTRDAKIKNEININHTNNKYLNNIKLPNNLICSNDLEHVYNADVIVFAIPYPYILDIIKKLNKLNNTNNKIGVLLTKGFHIKNNKFYSMSKYIQDLLNIEMTVLSGANVAKWIAKEEYASATIGCLDNNIGNFIKELFIRDYFSIEIINNIECIELFGCIKNIIALGSGIIDGIEYNTNTKAEIIRIGCLEMIKLIKYICPYINNINEIFYQNCGLADVITTCYGGRNRLCGEEFVKKNKKIEEIEDLLDGQKLQGPNTLESIYVYIKNNNLIAEFPLFTNLYNIFFENASAKNIFNIN